MRTLIVSGSGRYADPWHPYAETSACMAGLLQDLSHEVAIDEDVDAAMTRLADVDLLVVNAGDPWRDDPTRLPEDSPGPRGFAAALERGMSVLALHSAVATLRDYSEWAPAIGGM